MKRLSTIVMCLFAMMLASLNAKAQEVTINLWPGWTWISYPEAEVMDVATALGDFVPAEGDKIKSQFSSSIYTRGRWMGGVTHFMPGWGYMYYSNRTEMVSFVFGTPAPQLIVTTAEPTEITATSAISGGSVTSNDGSFVLMKGICWATHPYPIANDDYHTEDGSGTGSFTVSMTDLIPNTTYYVRAYAVSLNGLTYGEQHSFTTTASLPMVTTSQVTNITQTSAIGGGNVIDSGGATVTERGICWSTSHNPTTSGSHANSGTGAGTFTVNMTGLTPNTTYQVRAYAINSAGTNYGSEVSFTTQQTQSYTISVSASPSNGGTVSGGGTYQQGQSCTINATANSGYTFTNWTENGNQVSTQANYTFTVNSNRNLVANFNYNGGGGAPTGAINGLFTINSNGNKVYFSQGNLQYIGSATTPYWKFADNQWDVLGTTTGQNSSNQNVDRDLFGWGTSGYNHGANCYQPWRTSQSNSDYYAYGNYQYNLNSQTGQADWGYNPISNGGNQSNLWRTLTRIEWDYVFNSRATNSGIRYAKACVNNMNGVILLPDDWNISYYTLSYTNNTGADFSSNTITASEWSTLEQYGVVFLPAAGRRSGTSIITNGYLSVGVFGSYWSAAYYSNNYAYRLHFGDSNVGLNQEHRYIGFSVRLVREAQ